jgi:septum formation protein
MKEQTLILASSSKYRRELLERLNVSFSVYSPDVDETPQIGESPTQLVKRLSHLKARCISEQYPDAWVIGSDQVADFHGAAIGKPMTHDRALAQLQMMQGETVIFRTGMCLMQLKSNTSLYTCVDTEVSFRDFDEAMLENYLLTEKPYDCAGSAKAEGLGIGLLSEIKSTDPTAIIGLPLIQLTGLLMTVGFKLFTPPASSQ